MTSFEEYINLLSDNVISDEDKEDILVELLEKLHPECEGEECECECEESEGEESEGECEESEGECESEGEEGEECECECECECENECECEDNYVKLYDYTISKYPEMKQYEFIDPNKKIVNAFEIFAEYIFDDCQDELYYLFSDCKDLIDLFYGIEDEDDLRWNIEFDVLKQEKFYNLYSYMKTYNDYFDCAEEIMVYSSKNR